MCLVSIFYYITIPHFLGISHYYVTLVSLQRTFLFNYHCNLNVVIQACPNGYGDAPSSPATIGCQVSNSPYYYCSVATGHPIYRNTIGTHLDENIGKAAVWYILHIEHVIYKCSMVGFVSINMEIWNPSKIVGIEKVHILGLPAFLHSFLGFFFLLMSNYHPNIV